MTEPLCCLLYELKLNLGIRDDSEGPKFCASKEGPWLGAGEWLKGGNDGKFSLSQLDSDLLLTSPFPLFLKLYFKGRLAKEKFFFSSICP